MTDLTARRTALLAYAQSCLDADDYRGCRDACTDLEVIEARIAAKAEHDRYPDEPTLLLPEWFGKASNTLSKQVMAEFDNLRELINCAKPR